jgi:hypothetical protein
MDARPSQSHSSTDYQSAWDDYRRRRRWFLAALLGGFFFVAILAQLIHKVYPAAASWVMPILGPAWFIAFLVVSIRLSSFRCPRCGRPFFHRWYISNPLVGECMHCRLPKWHNNPDVA